MPSELEAFIVRYIHSVEQVETLSFFVESRARSWKSTDVYKVVQSTEQSVSANLRYFANQGILAAEANGGYKLSNAQPDLFRLAVELVETYRTRRVTVIDTIYKTPPNPIEEFSQAFKLRKDKP